MLVWLSEPAAGNETGPCISSGAFGTGAAKAPDARPIRHAALAWPALACPAIALPPPCHPSPTSAFARPRRLVQTTRCCCCCSCCCSCCCCCCSCCCCPRRRIRPISPPRRPTVKALLPRSHARLEAASGIEAFSSQRPCVRVRTRWLLLLIAVVLRILSHASCHREPWRSNA